MLAAVDVCKELQLVGINAIHIKLRGRGGVETKTPGPGAQSAINISPGPLRHEDWQH